jgi:TonB family protein
MHPATAQSLLVRRPSGMSGFVVLSVALHLVVLALAVVYGTLHRPPPIDLNQKPIKATLVRQGKPRDQKLLPRKEELPPPPKQVKAPAAQPAPTPAPTTPATVAVPVPGAKPAPPKTRQDGAKDGDDRRRQLFGAFDKAAVKADELEGAEDGDPLGDSAVQEGERYYGALVAQVRRYYDVAQTIPERERMYLKASVVVRIGRAGELLKIGLSRPSGNDLFDSAVLAAARKAAPFSPPPAHLRAALDKEGVLLEFTP